MATLTMQHTDVRPDTADPQDDRPRATIGGRVSFRSGTPEDTDGIMRLIDDNLASGHLLPRTREDVTEHAARFAIIEHAGRVIACAELAPLSRAVAEVRSLVVDADWRGRGLGGSLITQLSMRARTSGFATLCALTHEPSHFVRLGFSIAPHVWFPEKIALDCVGCARFRTCGQVAVSLQLDGRVLERPRESHSRLPVLPGTSLEPEPAVPAPKLRALDGSTK